MTGAFNVLAEAAARVRDGGSIVAITTSLVRNAVPGTGYYAAKTEEAKARMAAFSPFNRIGRPEESAEVVRYLASDLASWIQGEIEQPDGGMV